MYICYSRLWKLLAEKGLTKSDLMEITGLSSRVIAKLTKNETVTTDTIAKICTALSCDVADIMECSNESTLTLYQYCRSFGEVTDENENVQKIIFELDSQKYAVYYTKKAATKATHIECENDSTIYWTQHYMLGGMSCPSVVKNVLLKPKREAGEIAIVVIKGKPAVICGLDNGIFVSAKKGRLSTPKDVFVMSEAAFKVFEPLI